MVGVGLTYLSVSAWMAKKSASKPGPIMQTFEI